MITQTEQSIKERVSGFILDSVRLGDLKEDDDLFKTGVVNSLFAVQLMTFIEKTYDIEIGNEDLDIVNFRSINTTTAFIMRKLE